MADQIDIGYGPGIRAPDAVSSKGAVSLYVGSDRLNDADTHALIATVAGEGANQPAKAQQYIASTILNRAKLTGKPVAEIASDPSIYNGANSHVAKGATPGSSTYNAIASNLTPVIENGPVTSVTHFVNPKLQAEEGREYPAWGKGGDGVKVGDHVFYDRSNQLGKTNNKAPSDQDFISAADKTAQPTNATQQSDNTPSDQDFIAAADKVAQPVQPQHTPGYNKAYNEAKIQTGAIYPNNALGLTANALNQFSNGVLGNTQASIDSTLASLGVGLQNFANKHFGIGHPTGYSMSEAQQAGRQAIVDASKQAATKYPVSGMLSNATGFIASPLTKAFGVPANAARAAIASTALPAAVKYGLRLGTGAAELGAAGAAAGAGEALSEGGSPSDIGRNALAYGVPSAAGGALGEAVAPFIGKGVEAVADRLHPTLRPALKVGGNALGGAAVGGALGIPGGLKGVESGALSGAALGSVVGGKPKTRDITTYSPEAREAAVEHLVKTTHGGDYIKAADKLESALPEHTTAEAVGEKSPALLQAATDKNPNTVGTLQENVAARQQPSNVKSRLLGQVVSSTGSNVTTSGDKLAEAAKAEAETTQVKADRTAVVEQVPKKVATAVGINPAEAEGSWEDVAKNRREGVSKPLWEKVDTANPVDTEEHSKLLNSEGVVRSALGKAQYDLGPEGSAPNPKHVPPPENLITPKNITNDHVAEVLRDRQGADVKGRNVPYPDFNQETANYLNEKHGLNSPNSEPETLPTQKAWIQAERLVKKMIPRNAFGKVDYSNPSTIEVERTHRELNEANKKHFEGLSEAKASSGEDLASERAHENAYDFNPKSLNAETAEKFIERYNGQNDIKQKATQHGYLQRFFQKFRENPVATADEYLKSDQHQKVLNAMFGKDANGFNAHLKEVVDNDAAFKKGSGPIRDAIKNADATLKSRDIPSFNRAYDSATTEEESAIQFKYEERLNKDLTHASSAKDLEKYVNDDFEKHVQDKLYGKTKAAQLRAVIQKEIDLANSGHAVSKFSPKLPEEDNSGIGQAFGLGAITHGLHGAFRGLQIGLATKGLSPVIEALAKGRIAEPEVQKALGDILAQSPHETAKEIRTLQSKKGSIPLSKSSLRENLAKHALSGVGYATGRGVAHALSGYGSNNSEAAN